MKFLILLIQLSAGFAINIFAQVNKPQCTVYIVHYRHLTDDIFGTGLDPHNDRYPMQINLPGNKQVWLVGQFVSKYNYSNIKIIIDSTVLLHLKTIENPRTTNYSTGKIPHWSTFPAADTSIKVSCTGSTLYYKTVRYRKNKKLFVELQPLDPANKKDRPFFTETENDEPVAIYNFIMGEFVLNKNWTN